PRAAGDDFRAGIQADADVGAGQQRRGRIVGDADRQRAHRPGRLLRAQDIRRRAGRGHQQDHVVVTGIVQAQVGRAVVAVILGALDRLEHGAEAAGQQRRRPFRRPGKGGKQLHAVQDAQPARGAGADVDQPPAAGHARRHRLHRRHDAGRGRLHGLRRQRLIVEQGVDQGLHRVEVQLGMLRTRRLGLEHGLYVARRISATKS
ncbi:conserved hypothetical protein, partial [Ricinus communis]